MKTNLFCLTHFKRVAADTLFLLAVIVTVSPVAFAGDLDWSEPTAYNRPGCYWWWMGSAVDKKNIAWNLETMQKAGMGGGTIVPIYGVKGYEDQYIQHLSPEFVEMVSYAAKEAERLGMWVDMTTGTGWPFGGPMVTDRYCDSKVVYKNGEISQKFSGRNVKRAAPGGEGMSLNPYSADAMIFYLRHFDEPFGGENVVMPRAMYHDSFEYAGNWCKELLEEFKKLRGYDLMEHLPELFGEGYTDTVARIKADYRETLSDLHLEYIRTWVKWSESKGSITRNQAHGAPANLLDVYAAAGIPETETFGATPFEIPGIRREADNICEDSPQPLINRMASSAAHVAGKPLVAAETCTWIRNHFRTALSQVKPEVDQLFLNGINHIFFHGTCYSPKNAPWPGWLFYASLEYNPRNAIWRDAPLFNAYITRCQSILQSGSPDNDVALYWPIHDIWHNPEGMRQMLTVHHPEWLTESAAGRAAEQLKADGFGFDFISDRQLQADLGKPYKAIVVPKTGHIPLATLKKLLERSAAGQPVIFLDSLPADVPGFHHLEERQAELKRLLQEKAPAVTEGAKLKDALGKTEVNREPMVDAGLDFIRRRHENGYHYFVANMGAEPVDGWVELGVPFASAVIMDPRSTATGVAAQKGNAIYLQLKPGESRILRTFDSKTVQGEPWPILEEQGEPLLVKGTWKIRFIDGGPQLPADITTDELKSWTEIGDAEAQRFAGTARYSIDVEIPAGADDWEIDLGDVRESARVFINGQEAAGIYSVPFSARIGKYLKPGRNLLEIEVTNLSANRIRDLDMRKIDWKIFHDINFVDHNYKKFDASEWPLTPSGLLGPVELTPMEACEADMPDRLKAQDARPALRPNIVFMLCDDLRYDAIHANGNEIIRTPNIDSLAAGGVSFNRAFATTAICVTSRACIMTGQYAARSGWRHGQINEVLSPEQLAMTYHGILKAHGYQIGYIGKYHVGRPPKNFFDYSRAFAGQGQYIRDGQKHLTAEIGDQSLEALEQFSKKSDQPFMLTIGFKTPHVQDGEKPPFYPYDEELTGHLYKDARMPPPALDEPGFFESQPEFIREGLNRIRWERRLKDPEQYQRSVKGYYRLVSGMDMVVGRILDKLEKLGLSDNTIIVFSSDHSVYLGDRGLAGKWLAHESSIHIPLVVFDPRLPAAQRGTRRSEMAVTIDLAPTFLDWAGVNKTGRMQGDSLSPVIQGQTPAGWRTEFFYDHYYKPELIPSSEAVRTEQWKYIRYAGREPLFEELYNLAEDPLEATNLVNHPEFREQLSRMRAKWAEWRERAK